MEHFKQHKALYIVSFIGIICAIALVLTLFKRHRDMGRSEYLQKYLDAKDSLIAEKNRTIALYEAQKAENKETITYLKQQDSVISVTIQRMMQVDRSLAKQQSDVKNYIKSLGRNPDSIRQGYHDLPR